MEVQHEKNSNWYFIGVMLSTCAVSFASEDGGEILFFPVKYKFNGGQAVEPNDDYTSLYYKGHIYAPIRFVAERTAALVRFDDSTNTVSYDIQVEVLGPSVKPDQAKIVAYEIYHFKKVDANVGLRGLTDEELKQIPPEAKGLTPVYYIVRGIDQEGNSKIVCVSSNNVSHHFLLETKQ